MGIDFYVEIGKKEKKKIYFIYTGWSRSYLPWEISYNNWWWIVNDIFHKFYSFSDLKLGCGWGWGCSEVVIRRHHTKWGWFGIGIRRQRIKCGCSRVVTRRHRTKWGCSKVVIRRHRTKWGCSRVVTRRHRFDEGVRRSCSKNVASAKGAYKSWWQIRRKMLSPWKGSEHLDAKTSFSNSRLFLWSFTVAAWDASMFMPIGMKANFFYSFFPTSTWKCMSIYIHGIKLFLFLFSYFDIEVYGHLYES